MALPELTQDSKELCRFLIARRVEFMLVGGFAVGFHGYPRGTTDIDFWVRRSVENATRLAAALQDFGFGSYLPPVQEIAKPGKILRMGNEPYAIDVINRIDGVEFDECAPNTIKCPLDDLILPIISKDDLLRNKRASGRYKDLDDVHQLTRPSKKG